MPEKQSMPQNEFKVRLLDLAEQDLLEIIAYVAAENPTAAEKLLDKFETTRANLSVFPKSGAVPKDGQLTAKGYRYSVVENYLIFYTIKESAILLHRIVHGARDYQSFL